MIQCKACHSSDIVKYGVRRGIQHYRCRRCGRVFGSSAAPAGMRTPTQEIATALTMFYQGSTLPGIQQYIERVYRHKVATSTIYRWIVKYTAKASTAAGCSRANTSSTWSVYETIMELNGKNCWLWDILCEDTRFLLASHMSYSRTPKEGEITITQALSSASQAPSSIILDGLLSYPRQVERAFESETIHACAMDMTRDRNISVRYSFHDTIRQRAAVMGRLKGMDSARLILDGFALNYNFFTPNTGNGNVTPAEAAGIKSRPRDWAELIGYQP